VTGKRLAWEEEHPSHDARHTQGSLAQPAQEAAPGLAGTGCQRFGISPDLLEHDQPPFE
jgi:hypothetical protein